MGIDIDIELCPSLLEKVSFLGTLLKSFHQGEVAMLKLLEMVFGRKRIERIAAPASRQAEPGLPTAEDSETSPRQIVSKALTYLQNHQPQMRYPEYRKLGLPITSSHLESTIKELNYRIKGTEKFWSSEGGASVLQ